MRPTKWSHIVYQYSFGKNGQKAAKFFKVIIEKTFLDHNPGFFEYFTTFNILKCVELNSLQLS